MRILALLVALLLAPPARAILTWPTGPAPCNNVASLQACVDAAPSGEVIQIAANAIPAQTVNIPASFTPPKSLTLRPAAGFTPVFANYSQIIAVGGDVNVTIVIQGLTITRGTIAAIQGGEGTFDVTLRNNRILGTASFGGAIEIRSGNTQPPYGPTLFRVEDNQIEINVAATDQVSGISVGGFQGGVNVGTINRNVIRQIGGDQNGAIDLANGNATLQVDVIGNQISGSNFNEGVGIFQFGTGTSLARVVNNVISGQTDDAGAPAAISLNVSGGHGDFTVVNNTLAHNDRGILFGGRPDLGATAAAVIANNIVAFNQMGMSFGGDFDATTVNEFNLVFGNDSDFFTPGNGTIFEDPQFVSATNLRLLTTSPARDAGLNSRVPSGITTDVVGAARIRDGVVDIGAYEDGDDQLLLSGQCSGSTAHLPTALAALTDLGLDPVVVGTAQEFEAAITGGTTWDLVLIDEYGSFLSTTARQAIRDYIANGGRIYANYWNWDAPTAASFGATLVASFSAPPTLSRWVPTHPILSVPEAVADSGPTANTCATDGWRLDPLPGAEAIAGYTGTPAAGEAGLIVANGGRSVLLGTTPGLYPAAQMLPLLRNIVRFLLSPCADPGDTDCDGRPNALDLCPFYPEQNPTADANSNRRGDECECGDQNGDGRVDVADLVAINVSIFNPALVTALCDTNNDGDCNVSDIVGANLEIFSPGNTSTCSRQPLPGP